METGLLAKADERLAGIRCLNDNQLKLIAAICMLIDHVTKVFYESLALRVINPMLASGRLTSEVFLRYRWIYDPLLCGIGAVAFPIFAFAFTEGFAHTRSKGKFLGRLLIFALISELPFDLTFFSGFSQDSLFYWNHQNVFFTFAIALGGLWLMELAGKIKWKPLAVMAQCIAALLACCLAEFVVYNDYGGYGVFFIIVAYLTRKNRLVQALAMLAAKYLFDWYNYPVSFLISLVLILLYNGKRGEKNLKMFFYWFYPAHIAVIGLVNWLIFYVPWQ